MNRILLLLGIITLLGCSPKPKPKQNFPVPSRADIEEVIETVLAQDSLFYFKNKKPLSIDLQKMKVYKADSTSLPPPPFLYFSPMLIGNLLNQKYLGEKLFTRRDSDYLFFQNDTLRKFKIDTSQLSDFKVTTNNVILKKIKMKEFYPFYQITIPIFSLDQKRAYLEINDRCGMCGGGQGVLLEKVNGHWKIVKVFTTYMT